MGKTSMDVTKFLNLLSKSQEDAVKAGEQLVKLVPDDATVWDVMCLVGGYIASFLVTVFPAGSSDSEKREAAGVYQNILQKVAKSLKKTLEAI